MHHLYAQPSTSGNPILNSPISNTTGHGEYREIRLVTLLGMLSPPKHFRWKVRSAGEKHHLLKSHDLCASHPCMTNMWHFWYLSAASLFGLILIGYEKLRDHLCAAMGSTKSDENIVGVVGAPTDYITKCNCRVIINDWKITHSSTPITSRSNKPIAWDGSLCLYAIANAYLGQA